jgi:4-aminobutyrate aminotransferase/(S)-3-amino-2-methylpropionate transaminase
MFLKAFKNRLPKQTNLRMFASLDIAGEPTYPKMVSASLPGPITKAKTAELGETTCNLAANIGFMVDIQKSKGNYICDADGNTFLDMFMNISSTAMGHNHPSVLEAARSDEMVSLIANRTAQGMHPISQTKQLLDDAFMSVAPAGMTRVGPAMCGSCSVEAAFKHACIAYAQRKRGSMSAAPSQEELASCLKNQAPGSPDYAILSFKSAFHGRMFGCLSTTRSKAIHKLDMPSFDWPAVDPPRYKFPLADNEEYNRSQDDESLRSVAEIIDGVFQEKGQEVVAVVIEPILAEGGDIQISGYFANEIRKLTKEKGIYFIVDEVQSGVVTTGTYWAHE